MLIGIIFAVLILVFVIALYVIYRICFYEFRLDKEEKPVEEYMPVGKEYAGYEEIISTGIRRVMEEPYETVYINSYDGLQLYGRYYHRRDGAPVILMMHGYKGNIYRDGNGIFYYSGKYDFNILMVHQRAHGLSEGKTITFGVKERLDCKSWVEYLVTRFGVEQQILLCGLSMGAATVLMAADTGLPPQVKGIMADCGFSSPKEILKSVMESLKLPSVLMYPLVKLSAKLFGNVDLEETSAVESMKKCTVPVLLIHGEADTFVPCYMSRMCKEVCASDAELVTVAGAGHGMSYCLGPELYERAVDRFFEKTLGVIK